MRLSVDFFSRLRHRAVYVITNLLTVCCTAPHRVVVRLSSFSSGHIFGAQLQGVPEKHPVAVPRTCSRKMAATVTFNISITAATFEPIFTDVPHVSAVETPANFQCGVFIIS